jgi:hypothetical protein
MKTLPLAIAAVKPGRAVLTTALLAALWPCAAYTDMQGATSWVTPVGATAPAPGPVDATSAIQLSFTTAPPIACSPATVGTLASDSKAHLCLCDGTYWKLPDLDEPCDWKTAR